MDFAQYGGNSSPQPVFDPKEKKWTVEWSGGMRKPDFWFKDEAQARAWCENAIKMWKK